VNPCRIQHMECNRASLCPLTPRQIRVECSSAKWVLHAWTRPDAFETLEFNSGPSTRWGRGMEMCALHLKTLAAALLRLLEQPDHRAAAVQATLRSSLHHCALVSRHEVLPSVRLLAMKSVAAPKEWRKALARERRVQRGISLAPITQQQVDELSSDRQRALIRSLQAAAAMGVAEAAQLAGQTAAHFCACQRLHNSAQTVRRYQQSPIGARLVPPNSEEWEPDMDASGARRFPPDDYQAERHSRRPSSSRQLYAESLPPARKARQPTSARPKSCPRR